MSWKSMVRVVGLVAALFFGASLGKLIGTFAPANDRTVAMGSSIDVARAPKFEMALAPSDSVFEWPAAVVIAPAPTLQTTDAPSSGDNVAPTRVAPPPKAAPRPQRRAPVRYASRDTDDED